MPNISRKIHSNMPSARLSRRNSAIVSLLFVILFFRFLIPELAAAQKKPQLVAPESSVKVRESFDVSVDNVPSDTEVKWQWDPRLDCTQSGVTLSCRMEVLSNESAEVVLSAEIKSLKWSDKATVVIDKTGGRKIKNASWSPETRKMKDVKRMLDDLRASPMTEADLIGFFKEMGKKGLTVKEHLAGFQAEVINSFNDSIVGKSYWEAEYGHVERELMFIRREGVVRAWEAAALKYFHQHPDTPFIFKMDVGGWVTEGKEKMRFLGDIDFSIIMFTTNESIAIRDFFANELREMFGLDMLAIDALATAQRAATSAVYVGPYGADWAEIDAIKRGKIWTIEYFDGKLQTREATPSEKSLTFAILKNNVQKKLTGKDNLVELIKEKFEPKPTYDMEPGISLEFMRHIIEDGIHANLATHERIIKIAKYLNRSSIDHAQFLAHVPGMTLSPKDEALVDGVKRIMEVKQGSGTPEQILREIYKIAGEIMGPEWANNPAESLKKMGNRALEVIKHNIAEGVKARQLMIKEKESKKNPAEAEAEQKRLLEDLTTEFEEFKTQGVEFPKEAHDMMISLTEHFRKKLASLLPAEQKRLKELMEKAVENPEMTKIMIAVVRERIQHYYKNPGEMLSAFNNFLDTLDNVTLEKIRATGVVELEMAGTTYKLASVPTIAAINKALNDSVLGKIGQSQSFQAFNLGMEVKAYYDAIMNAETWTESFENLSAEIFRRRAPGGVASEAFVQGNYLRMGVEIVYAVFPPLAIPEGLYGMVEGAAEWGVGKMWEWRYEDMVNELYKGAKFEKSGGGWKISGLTYNCSSGGEMTLAGREDVLNLPQKCGAVFQTMIPQIKSHPVLLQYQEMLDKDTVSKGRMGNFPYSWDTRGNKYGEQLLKIYRKKVDEVALEYFKGVVEQLEKAQGWVSGKRLSEVIQIEKELGCKESLIKFNIGYFGGDRYLDDVKDLQGMVNRFNELKQSNQSILEIKDKWKANDPGTEVQKDYQDKDYAWVKGLFPECSKESIEKKAQDAQKLSSRISDAIKKCHIEAEKVKGKEKVTDDLLRPLVVPAVCLAVYEGTNSYIAKGCKEDYDRALNDLKGQESGLEIKEIKGPDTVCIGASTNYSVLYNRTCDECVTEWSLLEHGGQLSDADKPQVTWTPGFEGSNTLRLKVWASRDAQKADEKAVVKDKRIKVLPAEKCPEIKLKFNRPPMTVQENDLIDISVEPEGSLPEGQKLLEYVWSVDGQRDDRFKDSSFQFSGKGKKGKKVNVGVKAKTNAGYTGMFFLPITVSNSGKDDLTVTIMPQELKRISSAKPEALTVDVIRKVNSGRMKYQWTVNVNNAEPSVIGGNEKSVTLDTKDFTGEDKVEVTVLVLDIDNTPGSRTYGEMLRQGKDVRQFAVSPSGDIAIKLGSVPREIEDNQDLKVCVESPVVKAGEPIDKYSYEWLVRDDKLWRPNTTTSCSRVSTRGLSGQKMKLKVIVSDSFGRKAEKETSEILVVEAGAKPKLQISVTPERKNVTNEDSITFAVSVVPLEDSGQLTLNGVQMPAGMADFSVPISFKENENWVTVPFTVVDEKGRQAETYATIYVTKKTDKEKAEQKKAEEEQAQRERLEKEKMEREQQEKAKQEGLTQAPQTQTPQAPQVSSVLPPKKFSQLTEKEKADLLSCFCRCTCGGAPGCFYNAPVEKDDGGVLACPRVGMPPCMWGEWGCNYGYFPTSGECVENCYKSANVIFNPAESKRDIRAENRKRMKPFKVSFSPDTKPIRAQYGDIVKLTANAEGGIPGYTYSWSGNGEGKENTFTFINTRKPGSYSVSVTVNDSDGSTATASTTVVVEAISIQVEKTSPATDTVTVGGRAQFKATVMSGTSQASGDFNFQWQPHPEIEFAPFEKSAVTTATFRRPGTHNIYVQVLMKDGARYATLGESNGVTITVVNPSWKMEFNPPEPLIGQEVRAKISPDTGKDGSEPDMKEMNFRWQLPANARQKGTSSDDREITFYLTDDKPANISCLASTKYDNENLGGAGKTIKAKAYNLTINGPRPRQEFWMWKCETQLGGARSCGMKKVENQFAVDQEILFSSKVEPVPEKPVSYNWTASPEDCTFYSNGGSDTSITCRSTASYTVKVTAKMDGMEIGSATADVSVSISQDDIARSNKAKEAYEKIEKAKELVKQGKLDEGIKMADEASKLDPNNTEATALANKWKDEKEKVLSILINTDTLLKKNKIDEAEKELSEARKLHPGYQPVADAEKLLNNKKKIAAEKPGAESGPKEQASSPRGGQTPAAGEQQIFSNDNVDGVRDNPSAETTFRADRPCLVTYVMTYHYNGGKGMAPGKILLRHEDGTMYGPWQTSGSPDKGNQTNLYWECRPNVVIKPGVYTVIDTDLESWSWNPKSGGGITVIKGVLQPSSQSPAKAPSSGQAGDTRSVKAVAREDSGSKVGGQVKPVIATPPHAPQSPSTLPTEVAPPPAGRSESGVIDSSSGDLEGTWAVPTDVPSLKREIYFSRNGKSYTGKIVIEEGFGSNSFQIGEVAVRVTRVGANVYKGEYLSILDGIRTWMSHTFAVKDDVFYVTDLVGQDDMDPTICRRKKSEAISEAINVRVEKTSPAAGEQQIFSNNNIAGVTSGARSPSFTIREPHTITEIYTYHYGYAGTPGQLSLRSSDGRTYGPWQASGRDSSSAWYHRWHWHVFPQATIPPGTYTIIDSNPGSWSQNSESRGLGMAEVKGVRGASEHGNLPNIAGTWFAIGETLTISQNGNELQIKGSLDFGGTLCEYHGTGTIKGNNVEHSVVYTRLHPNWDSRASGKYVLELSPDGKQMTGKWYNGYGESGNKSLVKSR